MKVLFFLGALFVTLKGKSQLKEINSFYGIKKKDLLFEKVTWSRVDFSYGPNIKFFQMKNELPTVILNAALNGELTIYKNDSLTSTFSVQELQERIEVPSTVSEDTVSEFYSVHFQREIEEFEPHVELFSGRDMVEMEIKESHKFDKNRSMMFKELLSFNLIISRRSNQNEMKVDIPVASFSFQELSDKVLDSYEVKYRDGQKSNALVDFLTGNYNSYIVKVENSQDLYLDEIYEEREAYFKGLQIGQSLLEYEYNLWTDHP